MTRIDSVYDDTRSAARVVREGNHRDYIGGLWEELGQLQLDFLKYRGLRPDHKLLDLGCGCLRAGVHFVDYLDAAHYYGIDISEDLLSIGYEVELRNLGLCEKLPREHLIANSEFSVAGLPIDLDVILATSVFTHISFNRIRLCLERVYPALKAGGTFYASIFVAPEDCPTSMPIEHTVGGITTYADQDPYHYRISDLQHATLGLPWKLEWIGDWNHPRQQKMAAFHKV